jgi:hypothetical protein
MKQFIFCLTFFVFLFVHNSNAQIKPIELILNNGDTIKGFGKLKKSFVKYKNKKTKFTKIDFSKVKTLTITFSKSYNRKYRFLKEENGNKFLPFEEIILGKLSLYIIHTTSFGGNGIAQSFADYYLIKENEDKVTHFGSSELISTKFNKIAKKYFSDCKSLLDKLESKVFRKKDIMKIVEYYNEKCK